MMFRILNFLEMLPVWRSHRLKAKKYRMASGQSEFGTVQSPSRLSQTHAGATSADTFLDGLCDTADADARRAMSWLGLRESFSAVDAAAGADMDMFRLSGECN